jgi:hypothetical protein
MKRHVMEPIAGDNDRLGSAEAYLKRTVSGRGATAILAYGHLGGLDNFFP